MLTAGHVVMQSCQESGSDEDTEFVMLPVNILTQIPVMVLRSWMRAWRDSCSSAKAPVTKQTERGNELREGARLCDPHRRRQIQRASSPGECTFCTPTLWAVVSRNKAMPDTTDTKAVPTVGPCNGVHS